MKFFYLLFLFFLFSMFTLSAQKLIKGSVVDENKKPIDYFNVELLNVADSSLIAGGSFVEGRFEMKNISEGDYLLRISSMGYEGKYVRLTSEMTEISPICLYAQAYNLDGVTVNATPPRIVMKEDKWVVNVENTYISDAGNLSNALQRVPFVMVNKMSGEVSVAGRGATLVLIDGRRLRDNQELQLLNSNQIKRIEIIENPSAKYEAEGHAVINIITKKELRKGLSGNLYTVYLLGRHSSGQASGELTLNTRKLTLYAQYGYSRSVTEGYNSHRELFQKDDRLFKSYSRDIKNKISENRHNYSTGFDYRINPENTFGVQVNGYIVSGKEAQITLSDKQKNETIFPLEIITHDEKHAPWRHTVNVNYSYQGEKFQFVTMADYTRSRLKTHDDIHETDTTTFDRYMDNLNLSDYDLYSLKADFTVPLKTINSKLEFGGKFSSVANDSKSEFLRKAADRWVLDSTFSSEMDFSEQIAGIYAMLSGSFFKKLQYSAGLRYEQLWNKNEWSGKRDSVKKTNQHDFYPSVSLLYRLSKDWAMRLAYTRRIQRPNYALLNNSLLYLNSYSVKTGNPYLKSAFYNTVSYSVVWRRIVATLAASYIENPKEYIYINDPVNIENYTVMVGNTENRWRIAANVSGSFKYKIWNFQPSFSFSYMPRSIVEDGIKYTTYYPAINARLNNQLQLTKTLSFDCSVVFDRSAYAFKEFNDQVNMDVSFQKKMLKNKLTLQATYHHEFYKWNQYLKYSYKMIDFWWNGDTRNQFMASLQYNFNTEKNKFNKKSGIKEEMTRLSGF